MRWALGALVVLISAAVVGTAFTSVPHTGGDNAGYIALAHGLLVDGSYTDVFDPQGLRHTKYPPVFPALLALLIAFGARTWVVLKMAAAVPTVVAVGFTYAWAERRVGQLPAFGLALLLALSSGIVYYSHWVLSDPLFLALTVASLFALSRAVVEDENEQPSLGWLVAGVVTAGLAYFTRSAGLPLIVAILGWLALSRRWRALFVSAFGTGIPMFLWWLRGRGEGVAQYGTEFWMVNPYDPAQGTIGLLGLMPRIMENASSYVFQHGPTGVVGTGTTGLALLGVVLTAAAVTGWLLSCRERIGPTELFFPLYAGLILVWPAVWGGDRFALPLYPVVFLYGFVALREVTRRLPTLAGPPVSALVLLVMLLPAAGSWLDGNRQNAACEAIAKEGGPWSCYGPRIGYFVMAASWTSTGLPAGVAVLSRKPRHFYLLSGHPSRAFPFEENAGAHLALADELGARYVLVDQWDGLAARHVGAAVRQRPGSYCYVRAFGQPAEGGAQLLGIFPAEDRPPVGGTLDGTAGITSCPDDFLAPSGATETYSSSSRIPLLDGLDS
jgi:4-amino-4-deoxy-L-arabinose transferase-like glycosyltransferase